MKSFIRILGLVVFLMLAPFAVGTQAEHENGSKSEHPGEKMLSKSQAKALIRATTQGSLLIGRVDFYGKKEGVKVIAHILNVSPTGNHGFHIHENGNCAEEGNAAGGHFNPDTVKHGLLAQDGLSGAHAGDLGNITIDIDGSGSYFQYLPGLSLSEGKYNIVGKSVIVHAQVDDFGQPTGNAGGRIGCGIIEKQ